MNIEKLRKRAHRAHARYTRHVELCPSCDLDKADAEKSGLCKHALQLLIRSARAKVAIDDAESRDAWGF